MIYKLYRHDKFVADLETEFKPTYRQYIDLNERYIVVKNNYKESERIDVITVNRYDYKNKLLQIGDIVEADDEFCIIINFINENDKEEIEVEELSTKVKRVTCASLSAKLTSEYYTLLKNSLNTKLKELETAYRLLMIPYRLPTQERDSISER